MTVCSKRLVTGFLVASMTCIVSLKPATLFANEVDPASVQALFQPGSDLLDVKLSVDKLIDPVTDVSAVETMVDHMADIVKSMAGEGASGAAKLAALKRYLYEDGSWNDNKPFRYDLTDPQGEKPANRLLQRYLTTRRGNCITMPMLMMFVGERLGLRMTLASAPLHMFIKYTDDGGKVWNLEATSGGGFTRDVWYRQQLSMSDQAVANGVYLRALSHDEAVALIASGLVDYELAAGDFESAVAVADVLLRHYPTFAYLLAKKGSAYGGLLHRELAGKYTRMQDIPLELKAKANEWYRLNDEAFAEAEALGWRPQDGQTQ